MNNQEIVHIPISEIRVVNPRSRNKLRFEAIVTSIAALGLKRPITVSKREPAPDGTSYDLVCGQGRLEAFVKLGEFSIPAIVIDASLDDQYLMSLVENIARQPPSKLGLLREIRALRARGYTSDEIAEKIGFHRTYIYGVVRLIEHGEDSLVAAVEAERLPVTVAVEIAAGTSHSMQLALSEAYERGELRGSRLRAARNLVAKRVAKQQETGKCSHPRRQVTKDSLVRDYEQQVREQKALIRKAAKTRDRLLLLSSAMKTLLRKL
ncbi:MAG: chromosome partitioning protein ParB [Acidobacteria bacterium]|nr:MAG: chromosome partitioning protein ParB [Acidobacteriota bacterium]